MPARANNRLNCVSFRLIRRDELNYNLQAPSMFESHYSVSGTDDDDLHDNKEPLDSGQPKT